MVIYIGYNTFSDFVEYHTSSGRLDIFVRGNPSLDADYDELLVDKVDSSLLEYYIRTVML